MFVSLIKDVTCTELIISLLMMIVSIDSVFGTEGCILPRIANSLPMVLKVNEINNSINLYPFEDTVVGIGMKIIIKCKTRYKMQLVIPDLTYECLPDIGWSSQVFPICKPTECGPLPKVTNSAVPRNYNKAIGDTYTYFCRIGYTNTRWDTVICNSQGIWMTKTTDDELDIHDNNDLRLPKCVRDPSYVHHDYDDDYYYRRRRRNDKLSALGWIIIIFIILLLLASPIVRWARIRRLQGAGTAGTVLTSTTCARRPSARRQTSTPSYPVQPATQASQFGQAPHYEQPVNEWIPLSQTSGRTYPPYTEAPPRYDSTDYKTTATQFGTNQPVWP